MIVCIICEFQQSHPPVKSTSPPASVNRLCAPQRFHSTSPSDVKSIVSRQLDFPPNAPSLASLACSTARPAAARARPPPPPVETLAWAAAAVAIGRCLRGATYAARRAQHTDTYVAYSA
eukprot:6186938-Pleurochrysis_carterae.AAC.1